MEGKFLNDNFRFKAQIGIGQSVQSLGFSFMYQEVRVKISAGAQFLSTPLEWFVGLFSCYASPRTKRSTVPVNLDLWSRSRGQLLNLSIILHIVNLR